MNICSHQRSLITVSSNSQFSISWARSAETARLGQWTWVLPQKENSHFLSFIDPEGLSASAWNCTLFTNGQQWGAGGGVISLKLILTLQDSSSVWREKPQLSFQPCSISARLPPSRAWQHQLYSTLTKNLEVEFFLPAPLAIQVLLEMWPTGNQEDSIWWLSPISLKFKGLPFSDKKIKYPPWDLHV